MAQYLRGRRIHGEMVAFHKTLCKLPALDEKDTLVLLGDYIDRGPQSAQVIEYIRRELPRRTRARVVPLRGNHEDGWLRVAYGGWVEFTIPPVNGCLAALRSYCAAPPGNIMPTPEEVTSMRTAAFFPRDVLDWMQSLPYFYEDEHAIYVHAGLVEEDGQWIHPSKTKDPAELLWARSMRFYQGYRGKRVVCGTPTRATSAGLSRFARRPARHVGRRAATR